MQRGLAAVLLVLLSPLIAASALIKFLEDGRNPFYASTRVGLGGESFRMVKIRSMVVDASSTGVDTTTADDQRVTKVGRVLRNWKLDELPQLLHVVRGDMRFVGPRPNVVREVAKLTPTERRLLDVPPGLTDLSSVVFSDLGERLRGSEDPNRDYETLIRPEKSRLALVYIENAGVQTDLTIVALTFLQFFSKRRAQTLAKKYAVTLEKRGRT